MSEITSYAETAVRRSLAWLADAPMFIDGAQIAALYDAVLKPEYTGSTIKLKLDESKAMEIGGKAGGEVATKIGFGEFLKAILPSAEVGAKVTAEVTASGKQQKSEGTEIELHPIDTPQRQIVQLALHYMSNLPTRVRIVSNPAAEGWLEPEFVSALPRGLVFVDFPPRTKFVPTAAELEAGNVQPIYEKLMKDFGAAMKSKGKKVLEPEYPEPAYFVGKEKKLAKARESYWNFFDERFSSTIAMEAVEAVSSGGQTGLVRWIDYRVPLGVGMPCIHLHIQGRRIYDTGTFAYQLVKRGYKHGLRVVGTMKSEPAMNVLAIFEK